TQPTRVTSPWWMTTSAPPGCECQPDVPPGSTSFRATTMSSPSDIGIVPGVASVPRACTVLLKLPTGAGGVAVPGTALAATSSPANPSVMSARRVVRVQRRFICDSSSQGRPMTLGGQANGQPPTSFRLPPVLIGTLLAPVRSAVRRPAWSSAAARALLVPDEVVDPASIRLVSREPRRRLQPAGEVVDGDEAGQLADPDVIPAGGDERIDVRILDRARLRRQLLRVLEERAGLGNEVVLTPGRGELTATVLGPEETAHGRRV